MAVDLSDLVEPLRNEVSPPGEDFIPGTTDAQLESRLADAFYEAWLDGYFKDYRLNDTIVEPVNAGAPDLDPALARIIVLYAGYKIIRNKLLNMRTVVRNAVGRGAAETEVQRSAQLLTELLKTLTARMANLRDELLAAGPGRGGVAAQFLNAVLVRDANLISGVDVWVG